MNFCNGFVRYKIFYDWRNLSFKDMYCKVVELMKGDGNKFEWNVYFIMKYSISFDLM